MKIIQTLSLVLMFSINLYAKDMPENLLQSLPSEISYFTVGEMKVYDQPELGASVAYNRVSLLGDTKATIYVYDLGIDKINGSIQNKAYEMGLNDIYSVNTDISLVDKGNKTINIQNNNYKIDYSMFQLMLYKGTEKANSYIFVSSNQDYIFKVRISTNEKNMREDMINFSYKIIYLLLAADEKLANTLK